MEQRDNKIKEDKVVFIFENGSQLDKDLFESENFQSVNKVIDSFLRINSVANNRIFFGGDILDLKLFLTGILNFCYMAQNLELNRSFDYEDDEDFNYGPHENSGED